MKNIIIILTGALILTGITVIVLVTKSNSKPQTIAPTTTQTEDNTQPPLGGDKDEHGCIGSAGYSWCEAKQECIRIFEEDCLSEEGIKTALASKHNKQVDEVFIEIDNESPEYAEGNVRFGQEVGEGGMFLAAKLNNKWEIVFDGNGSVDCITIKQDYNFPKQMLLGFCD